MRTAPYRALSPMGLLVAAFLPLSRSNTFNRGGRIGFQNPKAVYPQSPDRTCTRESGRNPPDDGFG